MLWLTIAATISIPLSNPYTQSALGITVEPSCDLVGAELLELKTVAGNIALNDSFGIEASRLKISTVSGSISDDFALFKSLELYATSCCSPPTMLTSIFQTAALARLMICRVRRVRVQGDLLL